MRLVIVIWLLTAGCIKHKSCFTPPPPTPIRLVNSSGQDLLNPQNANSYSINNIRISYLENGITTYDAVTVDSILAANTFFLLNNLAWCAQNGRIFYLQLSSTDVDTIYLRCDKVSRNGCTYFTLGDFRYNNVTIPLKAFPGGPFAYEVIK